jgi:hypothetical protein
LPPAPERGRFRCYEPPGFFKNGSGGSGFALWSADARRIRIGYTSLSSNATTASPGNLEPALKDISNLGFHGFETFTEVLVSWVDKDKRAELIEKYNTPLISGYLRSMSWVRQHGTTVSRTRRVQRR